MWDGKWKDRLSNAYITCMVISILKLIGIIPVWKDALYEGYYIDLLSCYSEVHWTVTPMGIKNNNYNGCPQYLFEDSICQGHSHPIVPNTCDHTN